VRIALTYDLRDEYRAAGHGEEETAEFDAIGTIEAIEAALRGLGHETERVGRIRELVKRLAAGDRWDLVFNTAEGLAGFGREAQVPALLEAFGIPYTFADPLVACTTLHKPTAKRLLRDLGLPTPDFRVVAVEADLASVDLPFPLFVKPVAEGTAKGIDGGSRVATPEALASRCRHVLATWRQPALVEPYLAGREFTVGITGTGDRAAAVGTLEVVLREDVHEGAYTYRHKEECESLCAFSLAEPEDAAPLERLALEAWRVLDGRDAGRVDLRLDGTGRPWILEINPLPGLHPTHSDLPMIATAMGLPYVELISRIVASATERLARS
jgi:D-alanine-D-alanine ligase